MIGRVPRTAVVLLAVFLSGSVRALSQPGAEATLRTEAEKRIAHGERQVGEDFEPAAALATAEGAIPLAEKLGDPVLLARVFRVRALAELSLGEHQRSLRSARRALQAARLASDAALEAWALTDLGDIYFELSELELARAHFERALERMREAGNVYGEAVLLKDLGITYRNLSRLDLALHLLTQAVEKSGEAAPQGPSASLLANLGSLYVRLGADRLAWETYDQALAAAEREGAPQGRADVLQRQGTLLLFRGFPAEGRRDLEEAYALISGRGPIHQEAFIGEQVAAARRQTGDDAGAAAALERSLALWRRIGSRPSEGSVLCMLGDLEAQSAPARAESRYRQALGFGAPHHLRWIWRAEAGLARLALGRGDLESALAGYERAVASLEAFRDQLPAQEDRTAVFAAHQQLYREWIGLLVQLEAGSPGHGYARRAFAASERARAGALWEALAETPEPEPVADPDFEARAEELRREMATARHDLARAGSGSEERARAADDLERFELRLDQLEIERRLGSQTTRSVALPPTIDADRLRPLLRPDQAMLSYLLTDDQSFVLLLTAEHLTVNRLPVSPSQLAARVRNFRELLAADRRSGWPSTAWRLYRDLLAPLRDALPPAVEELVIVPDGVLNLLPFEALLTSPPTGGPAPEAFLLAEFAISYAPSASVWAALQRAEDGVPASSAALLLLADPEIEIPSSVRSEPSSAVALRRLYEAEGLPLARLPASRREAAALSRYADAGSSVLTGAAASEAELKRVDLERFRIVHFATHGLLSRSAPARSAVVLAPSAAEDGFLQAREILHLRLGADLVVLAACETGLLDREPGPAVHSLGTAFLHAGARSVLASLWNVDDERTAELMTAFYRSLATGRSKAEALRSAKLGLLRRSRSAPPRHWAGFVLVGESESPVELRARRHALGGWLVAGVTTLVLGGLFLAAHRRRRRDG